MCALDEFSVCVDSVCGIVAAVSSGERGSEFAGGVGYEGAGAEELSERGRDVGGAPAGQGQTAAALR